MSNHSDTKLGIIGLDGHGPIFANELNSSNAKIEGMRIVAALPVPSIMISEKELKKNIEKTRALGVKIVDTPEDLVSKIDGILILHDNGARHYQLIRQFVDKGKPIFVDKPLEASLVSAQALVALCRENNCPVFTASSLRFSLEIQKVLSNTQNGKVLSVMTYSPYIEKPTMPCWIYYAIHAIEPLYALMGPGCRKVRCITGEYGPVAIGTWKDGRTGIAKGIAEEGHHGFGFTVWREKTTEAATVNVDYIYPELLKNIKMFVETCRAPVAIDESLEVIAFMEAANESMENDGKPVAIKSSNNRNRGNDGSGLQ